jgi:hypothetical protein
MFSWSLLKVEEQFLGVGKFNGSLDRIVSTARGILRADSIPSLDLRISWRLRSFLLVMHRN